MTLLKAKLPPNPYKRSPIKKKEDLAGRDRELKAIRYYLGLTAAGRSPHLALIGQRGVGKTSLLNGAETVARELGLLPVRLDMNEQKANSQWIFWRDMYQTLALAMAKAGCWGGLQGKIYADLFKMMYAQQPGSLDSAVLQIPFVFSCHQGAKDSFECPDALVVHDFESCMAELQSKGYAGIAVLIDEADCLGKNVPLLQVFRNIFQALEHCSLLLAGTEAVFPALSEVFSPIPRQFHRIDIKPFARWLDTRELVLHPIPKEIAEKVAPSLNVVRELHELCGGAPDEVQLYCHHMYRSVEDGSTSKMSLAPQVFREILREYRSNSTANVDAVLNAIERLPDNLLFESAWVSRRNLALEENVKVTTLRRGLKRNQALNEEEKTQVLSELTQGYSKLFQVGITELERWIRLAGAPLSTGFWKSFVEVERGKRWTWDDSSYAESIRQPIVRAISKACGAVGHIESIAGKDARVALQVLRDGKRPPEIDEGMGEMMASALFARDHEVSHVADVTFKIDSPAGKQTYICRFFEKKGVQLREKQFRDWIESNSELLACNQVLVTVIAFDHWELPTPTELHRLGRISEYRIPDVFGPDEHAQALEKFRGGDVDGCMGIFSRMLADKENAAIRNNLAFCQLLKGECATAFENAKRALEVDYHPLYELNKGIGEYLLGHKVAAAGSLRNALQRLRQSQREEFLMALCVLIVKPVEQKAYSYVDIPVEAAILINLGLMGELEKTALEMDLNKINAIKAADWISCFSL